MSNLRRLMVHRSSVQMVSILFVLLIGQQVWADPLKVTAIPWVQQNTDIPHIAVNGQSTILQAIAEHGDCGPNYRYRWDWNGDGDYEDADEGFQQASSVNFGEFFAPLPLEITFPDAQGDRIYYPKVQVECGEEIATSIMPVLIRVNRICSNYINDATNPGCGPTDNLDLTRQVISDRAIDRALWYLFNRTVHSAADAAGHNVHTCTIPGTKKLYSTGHAMNAFLRRGHGHGEGRDNDPYYRHFTQCGLHAMMDTMTYVTSGFSDSANAGRSGYAIAFTDAHGISSGHWSSYESTAWVEPIANFGDGNYVSQAGSSATFNRSLKDIGQDLADGLIRCMTSNGGWHYGCGESSTTDASTTGWAPEALRLLERKYNVDTYTWAKNSQRSWLSSYCPNGYCSYHNGGPKLAGNALVGHGWVENQVNSGAGQTQASINAAQDWFMNDGSHWGLYYMYATTKGFRSFVPEIKYLPNGTDWSKVFVDFFVSGYSSRTSDVNAKQSNDGSWSWVGNWGWGGSIGTNERTGLTIQMIQTWLEVWAYARAFPEFISPGAAVTFDHSWSYTLDPSVNIFNYKWNVIDYVQPEFPVCQGGVSGCLDQNDDGDCLDEGEQCNEDLNGNGLIEENEMVWDFETTDPFEQFSFIYSPDIDWGEEEQYKVRLRVTDTQGRYVDDIDSVKVVVSKHNNPPTVVPHPLGSTIIYSGYADNVITLDGRASYDVDSTQVPYPGDNSRPAGVVDYVTSIHFDLNLDGDFDDEGEDGTNNAVELVLNAEAAIGDLISIPIRVCDDGQWTNECLDGLDAEDCSKCTVGSASVRLLLNSEPPTIDVCGGEEPAEGEDCTVVTVGGGSNGISDVFVDLGGTQDPEGALGIIYQYILMQGDGEIITDPAYDDKPDDMGPSFTYKPNGEGTRVDIIKVIATDSGGLSSEEFIEFMIPNIPPIATWGRIDITSRPPAIVSTEAVPEGDGRYRITVISQVRHGVSAIAYPSASDIADEFTTYVSIDGPAGEDFTLTRDQLPNGTPEFELADGHQSTAYVWAIDDDNEESSPRAAYDINIPNKSERLTYTFDVNSDGIPEADRSAQNSYIFTYSGPDAEEIPATVTITDDSGASTTVNIDVVVANRAPVFEQLATLDDSWIVTFVTSAYDPDEDTIRYTFDAGDGSPVQTNRGGIFIHTYPIGEYASYQPTITAWDGRGGEAVHQFEVVFEPEENLVPIIDSVTPTVRPGGQVTVAIEARDPEGEPLNINLDWGDGTSSRVFGGSISRELPYGPMNYSLTVTASDPSGQQTTASAQIELIDSPTVISRVQQNRLADGSRFFTVQAFDEDSPSLRYYWDYNNDGGWDSEDNIDNSSSYEFPTADEYTVRVGVKDPWSGVIEETQVVVNQELPPEITSLNFTHSPRGEVHLLVDAYDPEGGPLSYEIKWGNEDIPMNGEVSYSTLAGGEGTHYYDYQGETSYSGMVKVTDRRGLVTEQSFELLIEDHPSNIDEIAITQTIGGEVLISVTAEDADTPEGLVYDFDFDSDGTWDAEGQLDPLAFYTYAEADSYDITIRVTDPWSAVSNQETVTYSLTPWNQSAIADDHVLGEEGRCVVFRVDPALVTLEAKVDPTACDTTEETDMDWLWDFGDGFTRWGAEAGHRYADDGIYLVTVGNQDERLPRVSQIQAHISNLAPSFVSDPVEVVAPGESYVYEVRLEDAGITDELQLALTEGAPEGMEIIAQPSDRVWHVVWQVPVSQEEGPIRITLVATDGHYETAGVASSWIPDGGRTEQRYWLTVRIGGANGYDPNNPNGSNTNNGSNTGDGSSTNTDGSSSTGTNGEAVSLEEDYVPSEDRTFAGGSYATSSCEQGSQSSVHWFFLLLLGLSLFNRQRMVKQE